MKKVEMIAILILLALTPSYKADAQVIEIIKNATTKVIKAVDLQVQRLQTKTIWLQNAQKILENTMSKLKLNEITGWVQQQKDLYTNYFDELRTVKTVITSYYRVKEIIDQQKLLVSEYEKSFVLFKQDPNFTAEEIRYMETVYSGTLGESIKNLDQVFMVINSFNTQMSDEKRIEIINHVADQVEKNFSDLRDFNNENVVISLQRAKEQNDVDVVKKLYGLE